MVTSEWFGEVGTAGKARMRAALVALIFVGLASVGLTGCDRQDGVTSRPNSGGAPNSGQEKPDPTKVVVEKKRPLLLQKPTLTETEFSNVMQLEFGTADQASFSFTFSPEKSGSLYFTSIQTKLSLEECSESTKRKLKYGVYWQEDLGSSRTILKPFVPDITEFPFEANKKYILSFVLLDLKGQLADCKSATLKFASFAQNYNE